MASFDPPPEGVQGSDGPTEETAAVAKEDTYQGMTLVRINTEEGSLTRERAYRSYVNTKRWLWFLFWTVIVLGSAYLITR